MVLAHRDVRRLRLAPAVLADEGARPAADVPAAARALLTARRALRTVRGLPIAAVQAVERKAGPPQNRVPLAAATEATGASAVGLAGTQLALAAAALATAPTTAVVALQAVPSGRSGPGSAELRPRAAGVDAPSAAGPPELVGPPLSSRLRQAAAASRLVEATPGQAVEAVAQLGSAPAGAGGMRGALAAAY